MPRADVLIIVATDVEAKTVMRHAQVATRTEPKLETIKEHAYYNLGVVNDASVWLGFTEMGSGSPGASQQSTRRALKALKPYSVFLTGIAFGKDERKQKIGDVLISQQVVLYDLQRIGDVILLRGDRPHASTRLIQICQACLPLWTDEADARIGLILTGDKLVDNLDYRDQLRVLIPEMIGGEMEAAGLYVACKEKKVDWIVVKAICDWADGNKANPRKAANQATAASNATRFVFLVLSRVSLKAPSRLAPGDLGVDLARQDRIRSGLNAFLSALADFQPPTASSSEEITLIEEAHGDLNTAADELCRLTRLRHEKTVPLVSQFGHLLESRARLYLSELELKISAEERERLANLHKPNTIVIGESFTAANMRHNYYEVGKTSAIKALREIDGSDIDMRESIEYEQALNRYR